MSVSIYTDGSCLGNPGIGGWAFLLADDSQFSNYGNSLYTTNNIMELTAVIKALQYALTQNFSSVDIYTDSNYVKQGITIWHINWLRNNWKSSNGKEIKNVELWKKLISLKNQLHDNNVVLNFFWIKAHDKNTFNNMVDVIARNAANELR